ncbi:putative Splicing factor 3B subunit 10-domain-containing protein [Seiridium cardinale]|uniref:Splicing factor 3B subunit 10-domain-containing protein n=1 Tax=Seiridium cardinale TaxID=138064 RepID=A0ABR2XU74_9PEZI
MADKLRTQQELERLQAKYIGTGHPDTSSWEWRTNIARDTYSSIVGHPPMLAYHSLAMGEPSAKPDMKPPQRERQQVDTSICGKIQIPARDT